ncbi:hypothetical protein C8J57DRAFT_1523380 [Mycena rebaudengoi]|nr:hypothetical protein C8J57DRAFT_1523380 [Mycena rebaudengoi]
MTVVVHFLGSGIAFIVGVPILCVGLSRQLFLLGLFSRQFLNLHLSVGTSESLAGILVYRQLLDAVARTLGSSMDYLPLPLQRRHHRIYPGCGHQVVTQAAMLPTVFAATQPLQRHTTLDRVLPDGDLPLGHDEHQHPLFHQFTDVKRELDLFSPLPDTGFHRSVAISGTIFLPGLRFPTGAVLGTHLIIAGIYLAHSYQSSPSSNNKHRPPSESKYISRPLV